MNLNLSEHGWLKNYLTFRQSNNAGNNPDIGVIPEIDHRMYRVAQPTGIMYGHPILPAGVPEFGKLAGPEKMKLVLVENFIQSNHMGSTLMMSNSEDFSYELASQLIEYYLQVFPEIQPKTQTIWGKSKSKEDIAEQILDKRLLSRSSVFGSLWVHYFHNSLLFIDVFFFKTWSDKKDGLKTIQSLQQGKDELRLVLLKIIAAAANADGVIEKEEKKLFLMFLKSAKLDSASESEARKFIDSDITLKDIDFPDVDSWLLKKYFLELAILTVWSDKVVNDDEQEFIEQLGLKLGFSEDEIADSFTAIQSFVLTNWDEIGFFLRNKDINIVSKQFVEQMKRVALKNKDRITTEIKESKELMDLLSASSKRDLSLIEKAKVREQLMDLLKFLPTFVIIALPGTFLTLPIMLKILPKSAFPSAFQN